MGSFGQVRDFTGGFAWTALESQSKSAQPYAQVLRFGYFARPFSFCGGLVNKDLIETHPRLISKSLKKI